MGHFVEYLTEVEHSAFKKISHLTTYYVAILTFNRFSGSNKCLAYILAYLTTYQNKAKSISAELFKLNFKV